MLEMGQVFEVFGPALFNTRDQQMTLLTGISDLDAAARMRQLTASDPELREWLMAVLRSRKAESIGPLRFSYAGIRDHWLVGPASSPRTWVYPSRRGGRRRKAHGCCQRWR
jgi:hypothetical protein